MYFFGSFEAKRRFCLPSMLSCQAAFSQSQLPIHNHCYLFRPIVLPSLVHLHRSNSCYCNYRSEFQSSRPHTKHVDRMSIHLLIERKTSKLFECLTEQLQWIVKKSMMPNTNQTRNRTQLDRFQYILHWHRQALSWRTLLPFADNQNPCAVLASQTIRIWKNAIFVN